VLVFELRGNPEYPGKKESRERANNKLSMKEMLYETVNLNLVHILSELRIEPGPQRREARALTTALALLPIVLFQC